MKMLWIISFMSSALLSFNGFDFSDKAMADQWVVINDGVMGGRSESQVVYSDEALLFTGNLSLENNGGFASVRAPWGDYDLSSFEEVVVRCSGLGGSFMHARGGAGTCRRIPLQRMRRFSALSFR